MRAALRHFRRAPGRILASILALTLAVGAVGVVAIPAVSRDAIRTAINDEGIGDIIATTTPFSHAALADLRSIDGLTHLEIASDRSANLADGSDIRLVTFMPGHTLDRLTIVAGRAPSHIDEVVVPPGNSPIGESLAINGVDFTVVGHGTTVWWTSEDAVYAVAGADTRFNRVVAQAERTDETSLQALSERLRSTLGDVGATYAEVPILLVDGRAPIEDALEQVSLLIGLLGVVAGLVALVLLASTTNTLITERTRDVAVMRALGGRSRPIRRRLRRMALGITGVALVLGLPLGIVISNLIARLVLKEFVGITPDTTVDWRVVAGSAVATLLGARMVAARAARRVSSIPLADALRDRDGIGFGRRWHHRLVTRVSTGRLLSRSALRSTMRRPGRSIAMVTQIATAVGATVLIPGLAMSIDRSNVDSLKPWLWAAEATTADPGLALRAVEPDSPTYEERGIRFWGELSELEVEVVGLIEGTKVFDPRLTEGRWITDGSRDAVVSRGFATREEIEIGERITVELPSGPHMYDVVGLSDDFVRAVYINRTTLAADAGVPGGANTIWSTDPAADTPTGLHRYDAVEVRTLDDVLAEYETGTKALVAVFGAIAAIVVGVAVLALISSMLVNLYERRHEFAALQAIGARRRTLRGALIRELLPLALVGLGMGIGLGMLGTRGMICFFESANSIDIGVVDGTGSLPYVAVATVASVVLLGRLIVRMATRRPVAATLRGAA